ncbi:MAG TPA: hypothetical protein VFP21_12555 [Solirubrobacterales bacterium]|nr:hypothetical protein [Solirubrobacterales bacterium]
MGTSIERGMVSAAIALVTAVILLLPGTAFAISAPIHIANTGGEGVFIRPEPNTSRPAIGWMPEGASPDYHCFAWGQNINGVPIWFNVTYNGVTGYYASYFDDSSYHSNEELTAKYGVPLCGSAPASPAPSAPPAGSPPPAAPPAPQGVRALYFSPYPPNRRYDLQDGVTKNIPITTWSSPQRDCSLPGLPYAAGMGALENNPPQVLAGWSAGRVGAISFLAYASTAIKRSIGYVLLIDPGAYGEMSCDRARHAGSVLVSWLRANPQAHLVVISGSDVSQQQNSKGIQEVYFNAIREAGGLSSRVLICNYLISHENAYFASRYWVQHQIGSTRNACPWLSMGPAVWKPQAGWHP